MADVEWYTLVLPLIGGGAMGALITAAVTAYRNKIQPVGQRIEYLPIFKDTLGSSSSIHARITISDGEDDHTYENLHICQIQLVNRGNRDIKEFEFGVTLSDGDTAVYVEALQPDRHHRVEQLTSISLSDPKPEIDFILRPFNRRDAYTLQVFIVTPQGRESPGEIQLSSPQPINFVNMPTISEMLIEVATGTIVEIGPLLVYRK